MSKFKEGDIVKVIKVMRYGGLTSSKAIKEWKEGYINFLGKIVRKGWAKKHNCYFYVIVREKGEPQFYARELSLATEREKFLYHIHGSECLRENNG